jgi:methylenetetrahydrofolate dehydrogenase (NADP+)/methenyltetrahydrofolate cyclohydrolase
MTMPAMLIKGSEISKKVKEELKQDIVNLKENNNIIPGLATILVGEDEASKFCRCQGKDVQGAWYPL